MSTNNYDFLRKIAPGRTDWRIKVRVIREWRPRSKTGEIFKSHNLLLLDSKNCRMEAYVPAYISDKWKKILHLGKIYTITNFTVKTLTKDDKWRPVNIDRHISFTNQTKATEICESEYFISQNMFDFFSLDELNGIAKQNMLLADVVGVVIKFDPLHPVHTSSGKDKLQVKLKISDGRNKVNITFWEEMAVEFQNQVDTNNYEKPWILIVASGKVATFRNEIDICNFAQTAFYINYSHHSVAALRKMIGENNFMEESSQTKRKRRLEMLSVKEITELNAEYIEENVACQVTIDTVQEAAQWYYCVCTSCYKQIQRVDTEYLCYDCNRIVLEPDKKFGICVLASDKTGQIGILLMDRPIRLLFSKRVADLEEEFAGKFPPTLKTLEKGEFTIKLQIEKENIGKKDEFYLATDIFRGFECDETNEEENVSVPIELSEGQTSTSGSYHLEKISQLHF